jgi:hypothetical protein
MVNSTMIYADVVSALSRLGMPMRQLDGAGHITVIPAAGRVVAMAFTPHGPNLFWSQPQLGNSEIAQNEPQKLIGGVGGDRLWFAPELDYHWNGVPDWENFFNYDVPQEADPGDYQFVDAAPDVISLRAHVQLRVRATGEPVNFEVMRAVRMTPAPIPRHDVSMKNIAYVGIETSHTVQFDSSTTKGRVDLWHLLQAPIGSWLIVPLAPCATSIDRTPVLYTAPGGRWIERSDCFLWRYAGTACTKLGLSSRALTGRTAIMRLLAPEHLCLIVRQFEVDPTARYGDHPYAETRTDQAFQLWDGLGFGEMEYHSPMLDAREGPRTLQESDFLWAFAGPPASISVLTYKLLGIQAIPLDLLC